MIDLSPGHGWLDLVVITITVTIAFAVFFIGLAATNAHTRD